MGFGYESDGRESEAKEFDVRSQGEFRSVMFSGAEDEVGEGTS